MTDHRLIVTKLHRMNPSKRQAGWWYYSAEGYAQGPFDTEEEREKEIARLYKEHESLNENSYLWW